MNKRYQIFVSSTYVDLKEERSNVIQTLMQLDCIPSGMELFPAMDEDQFEFIKRVIDDCDYYLLILGGRYGSMGPDGIGYTEKEYDYAVAKGLKVIALVHSDLDSIPAGKTDKDAAAAERLQTFRAKVMSGRLVKQWRASLELPGLVATSLPALIKLYPAVGWVRGNLTASNELLTEINNLRKENATLSQALASATPSPSAIFKNIAGLDTEFSLTGSFQSNSVSRGFVPFTVNSTFGRLFALIAPKLLEAPSDTAVKTALGSAAIAADGRHATEVRLDEHTFNTFKLQLVALGLVDLSFSPTTTGGQALFWSLTEHGRTQMLQLRIVRVPPTQAAD